jgi:primosomal protein N'
MFYLVKVLIGRAVASLDRPFSYYSKDDSIRKGMRVLVSFGPSKSTIAFVIEDPLYIEEDLSSYQERLGMKLSPILTKVDEEPLLNEALFDLAKHVSKYYKADMIRVLQTMLPPSLKPKDSALKKAQGKTVDFLFANPFDIHQLSAQEQKLYQKIKVEEDGVRKTTITAKVSLEKLLTKNAVRIEKIPVSRIPEIVLKHMPSFDLTTEQQETVQHVLQDEDKIFLLQGVTGSGKTAVYLALAKKYLELGKGVLILVPEIALTDHMALQLQSQFKDTLSILNSSLSDARKYDEYQKILHGESKVVLGTRSAVFAPIENLGLIIIDEEHSSSYKQDNTPYYDAITVAKMRVLKEECKLLLGSATPRVIDRARADRGLYKLLRMNRRISLNQEKEIIMANMNNPKLLDPQKSSMFSLVLLSEIEKNLRAHQQTMILINRRGYSPIYLCRECHKTYLCPNCNIPMNYHKRDDTLRCHHCEYRISTIGLKCHCGSDRFQTLGYGTERAYEELRGLFPLAKITRLDSDVSSNEVRHQILEDFSSGETDILIGTEVIAKGHDFPKVSLAGILDCDSSLRMPTYLANEETFDLISQFVGRAGRKDLKCRVVLQSYVPDNPVIQLAAKQDYDTFYEKEMEERRKYLYPPYTYLTNITIRGVHLEDVLEVAKSLHAHIIESIGNKKFNVYGPLSPYIPYMNGRYYRTILLKYKSPKEADEILDNIKLLRTSYDKVEISINVDPGNESM